MVHNTPTKPPFRVTTSLVGYFLLIIFFPLLIFAGKALLEDHSVEAILISFYSIIFLIGGIVLIRKGSPNRKARIIWLLFYLSILTTILLQFRYKNAGLLLGLLVLFFIIFSGPAVFSRRQIAQGMLIGTVNLILVVIVDLLGNSGRNLMISVDKTNFLIAGLILSALVIIFLNFPRYPIRMKFIISVVVVSTFSAGMVLFFSEKNSTDLVQSTAIEILSSAAQQTTTALDNLVNANLNIVRSAAQLDLINQFLRAPKGETRDEIEIQLRKTLQSIEESQELYGQSAIIQDYFRSFLLLNADGVVVFDTAAQQEERNLSRFDFFKQTISGSGAYMSSVDFSVNNEPSVFFAFPIKNQQGQLLGVIASQYSAAFLQFVINQYNDLARPGSYATLIDENQFRLAQGNAPELVFKAIVPLANTSYLQAFGRIPSGEQVDISTNDKELSASLINADSQLAFSYQVSPGTERFLGSTKKMESQPWLVLYSQREGLFLEPVVLSSRNLQLLTILIVIGAAFITLLLTRWVISPIHRLIHVTNAIVAGDLSVQARVESEDEIGILADTMNNMSSRLQYTLTSLEQRVTDRTRALQRRSALMQAAAEVGRVAATIRDPEELFDQLTQLISDRFGFYHTGIFIVDDAGEYAVLKATNSEGGKRMLARGHKLAIGVQGLVGYAASTGKPRVALEVGLDSQYFDNPDMPLTRSEVALPLNAGGVTFGALDVQSTEPGAFSDEDVTILQVLADLIAVAIENARLFTESQKAVEAARRAYGELSSQSWQKLLRSEQETGYRSLDRGILNEAGDWDAPALQALQEGKVVQVEGDRQRISVPVKVHEEVIAVIDTYKLAEQGTWKEQEIASLQFIAEQVGISLENARLFANTQRSAERERIFSDISGRVRASTNLDVILRTAVQDLADVLKVNKGSIQLRTKGDRDSSWRSDTW